MLEKKLPSLISQLFPLYLVIFIGFLGYSLMITLFTPMLLYGHSGIVDIETSKATRTIILGVLLFLYPFGQFIGSPILGALSDHFGRKLVLLISLAAVILFYIGLALSLEWLNLGWLMISCFITGLFEGNIAIAQSAIADVTDDKNRNRFFGYIYLSASSAYVIGPLLGGRLADPNFISWLNYATPFWVVFVLLICVFLWVCFKFHETTKQKIEKPNYFKAFTNLLTVFTEKRVQKLYLANFLFYMGAFGFFRCYPMYLVDEFNMDVAKVSLFIAWVAVPLILASLFLTGRFLSSRTISIIAGLFMAVFMVIIIIPRSESSLWFTLFFTALGVALLLPGCASYLSLSVPSQDQGRVMGNNQSLQVGAEALSGLFGGLIAAVYIPLPMIILAIIAVIGVVILWRFTSQKNFDSK